MSDQGNSRGGSRSGLLVRYLAEIVVLTLLAAALVSLRFDLGERWFGWGPDPRTDPSAVQPPAGLRLPAAGPAPVVATQSEGQEVDGASVAAAVQPLLRPRVLGRHYAVQVVDLSDGRAVYRRGATSFTPASTTKLMTSAAALESLGPMVRFRTTVRWTPATRQVVLVGGGDPFLASSPARAAESYPNGRADLDTLARRTAQALRKQGAGRVRLAFDDSYFTGPSFNPAWPATYRPEDVVPPITSLWVDEGRSPSGFVFVEDPSVAAARAFAAALRRAGVTVAPGVRRAVAPAEAADLASVKSPPLGEIVERTLAVSDNQAAEVLARHVGLAERQEGSFAAGAASVLAVVRRLGVDVTGDRLFDGSGLSRLNVLTTRTLTGLLRTAGEDTRPQLRQVLTGLPVAGFTGSLTYRFDEGPAAARGRVRAKTGTLTGVHGLAGVVDDRTGARMAFVVVADRVREPKSLEAQTLVDRIAAALGACTCSVGSGP